MAGIQGQSPSALASQVSQPANQTAVAGGKSGAQPTHTAMGTPIIRGKTYLGNYAKDYVAPLAATTTTNTGGDGGGDGGGTTSGGNTVSDSNTANSITGLAAPANLSIPDVSMTPIGNTGATTEGLAESAAALAVDDASVSEGVSAPSEGGSSDGSAGGAVGDSGDGSGSYANGTTSVPGYYNGSMGVSDDPWAWTKVQPVAAPLGAEIKPSNEQALGRMPDRVEQQLGSMVMGKGIDAATKGVDTAYKAYNAAPLAAAADTGTAIAATGTGSAATGAALAGSEAALNAMGPVGMAISAGLLAKKLGIF